LISADLTFGNLCTRDGDSGVISCLLVFERVGVWSSDLCCVAWVVNKQAAARHYTCRCQLEVQVDFLCCFFICRSFRRRGRFFPGGNGLAGILHLGCHCCSQSTFGIFWLAVSFAWDPGTSRVEVEFFCCCYDNDISADASEPRAGSHLYKIYGFHTTTTITH
jgi:hypothetical protein